MNTIYFNIEFNYIIKRILTAILLQITNASMRLAETIDWKTKTHILICSNQRASGAYFWKAQLDFYCWRNLYKEIWIHFFSDNNQKVFTYKIITVMNKLYSFRENLNLFFLYQFKCNHIITFVYLKDTKLNFSRLI